MDYKVIDDAGIVYLVESTYMPWPRAVGYVSETLGCCVRDAEEYLNSLSHTR
jgi:hypothetical protein